MMRNIIIAMASITMVLASCSDEMDYIENPTIDKKIEAFDETVNLDGQNEANYINEIILNGIKISTRAEAEGNDHNVYPDYYGGSFIERNGTLKILLKGDSLSAVNHIKSIYNDDIVRYGLCKYSYTELCNVLDGIDQALKNADSSIKKNISAYGIDDGANRVIVYLLDCSDSSIKNFRMVYNHPSLEFEQLGRIIEEKGNICPGNKLYLTTYLEDESFGTFAFRAKEKSGGKRVGYVTAGHVLEQDDFCYISGKTVGECVKSNSYGGNADAAFIVVDTIKFEPSNYVNGNTQNPLSTVTSQPGVGTYVNKWGAATGNSGGYIKSTTVRVLDDNGNVRFTNMTTATYNSGAGDSGGIVYTLVKSSNTRYTVGVHHGRSEDGQLAIYSKADNVLNTLGVERY
jgi:hypothetical protein